MTAAVIQRPGNRIDDRITRPAFRQFGGKWDLADWIIAQFPPHITYFEPFGGAFSVGFRKQPALHQIYNDLHIDVFNFFKQIQDHPHDLITAIAASPRTEEEFERCQEPTDDLLDSARRYYLSAQLSWMGGGGRWSSGVSPSRLAADTDDSHLWAIADRAHRMTFWNMDAFEIIPIFDTPQTLFYIDPPYPHQARGSKDSRHKNQAQAKPRRQYQHEMTDDQHQALGELLKSVQGTVFLSGYDCPLYHDLYQGWERVETEVKTSANTTAVECLWIKPASPPIRRSQPPIQAKRKSQKAQTVQPPVSSEPELQVKTHVPLEPEFWAEEDKELQRLRDELTALKQQRDRLQEAGIAPEHCWIETCKIPGRPPEWKQAYWRSTKPVLEGKKGGKVKRRYIGKVGSPEHQRAIAAIARRKELAQVNDKITALELELEHS